MTGEIGKQIGIIIRDKNFEIGSEIKTALKKGSNVYARATQIQNPTPAERDHVRGKGDRVEKLGG